MSVASNISLIGNTLRTEASSGSPVVYPNTELQVFLNTSLPKFPLLCPLPNSKSASNSMQESMEDVPGGSNHQSNQEQDLSHAESQVFLNTITANAKKLSKNQRRSQCYKFFYALFKEHGKLSLSDAKKQYKEQGGIRITKAFTTMYNVLVAPSIQVVASNEPLIQSSAVHPNAPKPTHYKDFLNQLHTKSPLTPYKEALALYKQETGKTRGSRYFRKHYESLFQAPEPVLEAPLQPQESSLSISSPVHSSLRMPHTKLSICTTHDIALKPDPKYIVHELSISNPVSIHIPTQSREIKATLEEHPQVQLFEPYEDYRETGEYKTALERLRQHHLYTQEKNAERKRKQEEKRKQMEEAKKNRKNNGFANGMDTRFLRMDGLSDTEDIIIEEPLNHGLSEFGTPNSDNEYGGMDDDFLDELGGGFSDNEEITIEDPTQGIPFSPVKEPEPLNENTHSGKQEQLIIEQHIQSIFEPEPEPETSIDLTPNTRYKLAVERSRKMCFEQTIEDVIAMLGQDNSLSTGIATNLKLHKQACDNLRILKNNGYSKFFSKEYCMIRTIDGVKYDISEEVWQHLPKSWWKRTMVDLYNDIIHRIAHGSLA